MENWLFSLNTKEGIDIENKVKDLMKDLPQLIVALDSLDDSANYIHISDANYGISYYCPCCKGIVKAKGRIEGKEYKNQASFCHESGGCSEENYIHFLCKTWLFESGSKFKIKNDVYTVSNVKTEKIFHTQFGSYRPDIVVETEESKTFFFEIKYSNPKNEHYIPKWDELEIDVVEVDAREFINQKYSNNVPEFKLIYSDGECFIKKYSNSNYEDTIAKRKLEWKRQDKLNYKIQWERLDWFWSYLHDYIEDRCSVDTVLQKFREVGYDNIEVCWGIVSKMSCLKNIKVNFRNIVNDMVIDMLRKDVDFIFKKHGINNFEFNICLKDRLDFKWVICGINNYNEKHRFSIKYRKWTIVPSFISNLIPSLENEIVASKDATNKRSKEIYMKNKITESKNKTLKKVKNRIYLKNKIMERSDYRKNIRICKIMSRYITKKSGIVFTVFCKKDMVYLNSYFMHTIWFNKNSITDDLNVIKLKCNKIIKSINCIDIGKINKKYYFNNDTLSLTEAIEIIDMSDVSAKLINKILIGNNILSSDKEYILDDYKLLKRCGMFSPTYYSYYDSYSLRLNIFGAIWLKQNFEHLNDVYKDFKNKCTEIIKYFSQYEKVYNTFKIEKTIDCCNAYFDLMVCGGKNNPVTIINIDRKDFSFSIGKDYCGCVKDFDEKKADDALCDFLKWYMKDCENYGIRFFKEDKGGNVIE